MASMSGRTILAPQLGGGGGVQPLKLTIRKTHFGITITWILFNTAIMLVGSAIGTMGCLLKFSPEAFCFLYRPAMTDAVGEIYPAAISTKCINFGNFLDFKIFISVIVFGGVLFLLGLLAVITAVWPNAPSLVIYILGTSLYVFGIITVLLLYFVAVDVSADYTATDYVRDALNRSMAANYRGDLSGDDFSILVNFIHRRYNCCGIDGENTFQTTKNWNHSYSTDSVPKLSFRVPRAPLSCCRRGLLKQCLGDLQLELRGAQVAPQYRPDNWVHLGCFEGQLAESAKETVKISTIVAAIFAIGLGFSITLAFIICTPLIAAKQRLKKTRPTTAADSTSTSAVAQVQTDDAEYASAIPGRIEKKSIANDAVSKWHSQFGSRYYDSKIFAEYQSNGGEGSRTVIGKGGRKSNSRIF